MDIIQNIKDQISSVVVGQEDMINTLIIALLTKGHVLLESVPGLAKTTTINTLSKVLELEFKRVQFTPDLLPSDIIGLEIYNPKNNEFSIKKGPVFTNLLLADEINRAPAKVQSALLEAMQENQVSIGEFSYILPDPFLVLATQNPIESEGAYSLPEAQLDRFMFKILLDYNSLDEELLIAQRISNNISTNIKKVANAKQLSELKDKINQVHIDEQIQKYIIKLIFATRKPEQFGLDELTSYIRFGASPRGSIDMYKAVKANAFLKNRDFVTPVDVACMLKPVLRHRVILSYEAQANDICSDYVLDKILQKIPLP